MLLDTARIEDEFLLGRRGSLPSKLGPFKGYFMANESRLMVLTRDSLASASRTALRIEQHQRTFA